MECATHGSTKPAYVCQHLIASLDDTATLCINWLRDDDGQVNAWCDGCADFLARHGGVWTEKTEAHAGVTLICEGCFDQLAAGNPTKELN